MYSYTGGVGISPFYEGFISISEIEIPVGQKSHHRVVPVVCTAVIIAYNNGIYRRPRCDRFTDRLLHQNQYNEAKRVLGAPETTGLLASVLLVAYLPNGWLAESPTLCC